MLSDPKEVIRKMAVNKILDYRQSEKPEGVRTRILPALKKSAKNYHEMIGKKSQTRFQKTRQIITVDQS